MKIVEVTIVECNFKKACHYRLLIDEDSVPRGRTTGWSTKTKTPKFTNSVYYLNQLDTRKQISIAVERMKDGKPLRIAEGYIHGEQTPDPQGGEAIFEIGTVKVSYRLVRQPVIRTIDMADHDAAVAGAFFSIGLVGDHSSEETKYDDLRIRIRDTNRTIIGHGKIGSKRDTLFIQIDHNALANCHNGDYFLEIQIGESADNKIEMPLSTGGLATAIPLGEKYPNLSLIVTSGLGKFPSLRGGILHQVDAFYYHTDPEKEKEEFHEKDLHKKKPLKLLKRNFLVWHHMIPEGVDSMRSKEEVLETIFEHPFTVEELKNKPKVYGNFSVIDTIHRHHKKAETTITEKVMTMHSGNMFFPHEKKEDPVAMQCIVFDIDFTASKDAAKLVAKKVLASGILKETHRQVEESTGIISVICEGDMEINGDDYPEIKKSMEELKGTIRMRTTYSSVNSSQPKEPDPEGGFEEDDDEEEKVEEEKEEEKDTSAEDEEAARLKREQEEADRLAREAADAEARRLREQQEEAERLRKQAEADAAAEAKAMEDFEAVVSTNDIVPPGDINKDRREERMNDMDEMPGISTMEDVIHKENIEELYESFESVYDNLKGEVSKVGNDESSLGSMGMFSPKQILSHRKATKAGTALAVVIKAELVEKQKMIDRLLDEASARQDAIDLCGDEIRALRGEVDSWKSKAQDAFLEIRAHENSVKESSRYVQAKLLVKEDLISLSRTTLIEIILELSKQCREMGMKYNEMSERYAEGQSARNMYAEQQQKLQDLSDAHLQQSYFVQQLQKKVSKMDTYRSTIKLQEAIIGKMQKVVEAHLRTTQIDSAGGAGQSNLFDRLMTEIERSENKSNREKNYEEKIESARSKLRQVEEERDRLKKEKVSMEKEFETVSAKLKELQLAPTRDTQETLLKVEELEAQLQASGYRVDALQEQLELQSREAGKEISRLRTRLFDFEMTNMLAEEDPAEHSIANLSDDEMYDIEPGQEGAMNFKDKSSKDKEDNKSLSKTPSGSGLEAAKSLSQSPSKASVNSTKGWIEHDEVKLTIPLKSNDKSVNGNVEVYFKFKYAEDAPQPLQEDTPVVVIITKILLNGYTLDSGKTSMHPDIKAPEETTGEASEESKTDTNMDQAATAVITAWQTMLDLSFDNGAWSCKTSYKHVNTSDDNSSVWYFRERIDETVDSTLIEADKAQEMQFKSTFGTIACENLLAVAMKHNENSPDDHIGSGHSKFTTIDTAQTALGQIREEDPENPYLKEPAAASNDADAEDPSGPGGPPEIGGEGTTTDGEKGESKDGDGKQAEGEDQPSPRPVPTGKLQHNLKVMNAAVKMIGKVAAYTDDSEETSTHITKQGLMNKSMKKPE